VIVKRPSIPASMSMLPVLLRAASLVFIVFLADAVGEPAKVEDELSAPLRRVYSHLLDPRENPDYDRRAVKPPGWGTFKNRTQFTCLRGFDVQNDQIVGYVEQIEKFSRTYELGDVIWPSYAILFATNLADLANEIKRRDLCLFDIWGYVPGSGPGGYWQQFKPSAEAARNHPWRALAGDGHRGAGRQGHRRLCGPDDACLHRSAGSVSQFRASL